MRAWGARRPASWGLELATQVSEPPPAKAEISPRPQAEGAGNTVLPVEAPLTRGFVVLAPWKCSTRATTRYCVARRKANSVEHCLPVDIHRHSKTARPKRKGVKALARPAAAKRRSPGALTTWSARPCLLPLGLVHQPQRDAPGRGAFAGGTTGTCLAPARAGPAALSPAEPVALAPGRHAGRPAGRSPGVRGGTRR